MTFLIQWSMCMTAAYSYSLTTLSLQTPEAPYAGAHWITHFDANTNNIWLLGGHYLNSDQSWVITNDVQTYNIKLNAWAEGDPLSDYVASYIGSYTSIDTMVYFIAYDSLSSFNIDTQTLLHPHPNISLLHAVDKACVTNDGRYIFVIGGWISSTSTVSALFQIYDTSEHSWLEGLPLNIPRARSNCEYHNGYIYIFGGQLDNTQQTDSIEMIYVGVGDAVHTTVITEQWITLASVLFTPKRDVSTVMCTGIDTELIYIFGGWDSNQAHTVSNQVHIFNTTDTSIHTAYFGIRRGAASVICIHDYIYILLGYVPSKKGGGIETTFTWMKSNLLYTSAPTSVTNAPTTTLPTNKTHSPTTTVTVSTSSTPTIAPFTTSGIQGAIASFSCSYLHIYVDITDELITDIRPLIFQCASIFSSETVYLLGSDASCSWSGAHTLTVTLAPSSTLLVTDSIVIRKGAFEYMKSGSQSYVVNDEITMDHIDNECDIEPTIKMNTPDVIGICEDLLLDIRGNVHDLGGRSPESILWTVESDETNVYTVSDEYYVVIPMTPGSVVHYSVTVTAWYGASTTVSGSVTKSNTAIPSIRLLAPSIFDSHSAHIAIESVISFSDACLSDSNDILLTYSWSMTHVTDNAQVYVLDTQRSNELNSMLMGTISSGLMINVPQYLQKGFNYEFTLNAECTGYYECFVSESVTISYEYSPIKCQISGGNKVLTIPISSVPESIDLDGSSWSYDPDGNPLSALWSCMENEATDCSSLFTSRVTSETSFMLPKETYVTGTEYMYEFTLRISDANILSRPPCIDTITLQLNIVADMSHIEPLLVSLSGTATSLALEDKLRLIGDVTHLNGDPIDDYHRVFYEWGTVDDILSVSDIQKYQINNQNTQYLVLDANTLSEGADYEFVLSVYTDNTKAVLLGSASIDIYIKSGPIIFSFDSVCHHTFDHFIDSLFYGFDLRISADGDYTPLSYSFNLQLATDHTIYLHSYAQRVPYLLDVILPIECEFSIVSDVIDVQSTKTSQTIDCCITVTDTSDDDTDCFSYKTDVLDTYFAKTNADDLLSVWQINRYIFQTAFNVLHYLPNIHSPCRYSHFEEVFDVLITYFHSTQSDFCITSNNYLFTIQLAQTLSKWISIGLENDNFFPTLIANANNDYFALIFDLWTQSLDPCGVIRNDITSTDDLSVSPQSVISNQIIVLHQDTDITNQLPILLTNTDYFELLFASIDVVVDYLGLYSTLDIDSTVSMPEVIVFLQKVIHIAGLSSISRSIPTEFTHIKWDNFELYSIRNDSSSVDITVNDIKITLKDDGHDRVKDVVIFGISSNPNTQYNSEIDCNDSNAQSQLQGALDGQEVSVTIVNASQSSASTVNITMAFTHTFDDDEDLDDIACVWWNEMEQNWESSGCQAEIDKANGLIVCYCTHLTTFATITHLHNDCLSEKLFNNHSISFIMLIFAAAFGIIFSWIVYILMTLKCQGNTCVSLFKHPAVYITVFAACIAFLESTGCILFYFYTNHKAYAIAFSVLIMTPLVLYYFMFTLIINSWINVAYATGDASKSIALYQKVLKYCAIVIAVLFVIVFVLLSTLDHTLIMIAEITWSSVMCLCVIVLPYYGNRVIRLLTVYTLRQSVAHKRLKLLATRTRLRISICTFCIFFIAQCTLTIYFAIDKEALSIYWTVFDLSIHLICLYMICWLYKAKLYSLMTQRARKDLSKTAATEPAIHVVMPSGVPQRTCSVHSDSSVQSVNQSPAFSPTPRAISTKELNARATISQISFQNLSLPMNTDTPISPAAVPGVAPPFLFMQRVASDTVDDHNEYLEEDNVNKRDSTKVIFSGSEAT
eukprot:275285_1